jgi:hypothetical protein
MGEGINALPEYQDQEEALREENFWDRVLRLFGI